MNKLNLLVIILILLGATLGCLGPSAAADKCKATIKLNSRLYEGTSKTAEQAELNVCNKFCSENDETLQEMYRVFLESERAKTYEKRNGKKMSIVDAIIENKKMLDYTTKNCAVRCKNEANKGKHTLEHTCR